MKKDHNRNYGLFTKSMGIPWKDLCKLYIKRKKKQKAKKKRHSAFNVRRSIVKSLQWCMCKIRTDLTTVEVAKMECGRLIIFRKKILTEFDGRLNSLPF